MRVVCVCVERETENERAKGVSAERRGLTHVASETTSLSPSLILSVSLAHSSTQSFSHQRGIAPHTYSFIFLPL